VNDAASPDAPLLNGPRVLVLQIGDQEIDDPRHRVGGAPPAREPTQTIAGPSHFANSGMRCVVAFVHAASTRRPSAVG